jgi:hypothetical protein
VTELQRFLGRALRLVRVAGRRHAAIEWIEMLLYGLRRLLRWFSQNNPLMPGTEARADHFIAVLDYRGPLLWCGGGAGGFRRDRG